jgi:predicted CXXCH cytochrome family protein
MEYDNYLAANAKEYRGEVKLSHGMVFAEGKVGCLTCHNPLNVSRGHLVMNNDRSDLCFACHKK